jgi:hypothetical protein
MKLEVWNENTKVQGDAHIGTTSLIVDKKLVDEVVSNKGKEITLQLAQVGDRLLPF